MKYLISVFSLVLFVAVPNLRAQETCQFRLSGHVEDADTKETLAGATVRLLGAQREIVTDSKGDFVFFNLCAGSYTLLVTHVSCDSVTQTIELSRDRHLDIFMPHARNTLEGVQVQARAGSASSGFKQELQGRKLEETRGLSISEALSQINGVTLLQTGSTIAKPVIHGLHSNRILTINNGVRQEGQQWGNEHAPEIDAFIADKLTVIKGVDELKYGSDAIGGVILVQPKPLRSEPGWNGEFNAGYFTNNRQYVTSAIFEQQLKQLPALTYRLQGTYKRGANAATPNYRLNNTASEEWNFSATAAWRKEHFNTELFYSQFNTWLGIFIGSHIGNITDLENAIAREEPDPVFLGQDSYKIGRPYQDVTHQILKSRTQYNHNGHKFTLQLAGQFNNRKEFDIVRSSTITRPQLNLSISTFSEDLTWERPVRNHFSGSIGIAAMQQDNAYAGRYFIPNYRSYNYGLYGIEKWTYGNWDLQAGARVDHKTISTNRLISGGSSFDEYDFEFTTFAGSFNSGYRFSPAFKANINLSVSSRAPHVNELLSNGIHHGTATYEEGDINLKTEKSFNAVATLQYQNVPKTLSAEVSIYRNQIADFIYRQPVPDDPVLTIAGAFPLIRYQQTDAVLSGLDASVVWKPLPYWEWNNRASLLRARNRNSDDWLILMPADRVSTELVRNFKDGKRWSKSYLGLEVQHVFRQSRVPDDKNGRQDYKEAPDAYTLVNLNASTTIHLNKQALVLSVGVRNLLNESYRDYLNSMRYFIDEMGRNVNIRIQVPF